MPSPSDLAETFGRVDVTPADAAGADDRWKFNVTPLLWCASLDANVSVGPLSTSASPSFNDLLENLDLGGMAHLELEKSRWLLFSDLIYMDLRSDNNSGPLGITSIDARLQEYIGSLNAGYRVVDVPLDNDAAKGPRLTVDGYAGVRYTWMEATLNPFNGKTRSQSEDWWDPLIGARARLAVTPKFSMTLRYDYGGWGVGAERTWFLFAGAEWSVSEAIALGVGYATLYQDYYGSNTFHYEATMQGPVFSLAFNF